VNNQKEGWVKIGLVEGWRMEGNVEERERTGERIKKRV
jgi:hypothetical protein